MIVISNDIQFYKDASKKLNQFIIETTLARLDLLLRQRKRVLNRGYIHFGN